MAAEDTTNTTDAPATDAPATTAPAARPDDKDYIKGWTVQQGAAPEAPEAVPGNVVTPEQLPYKESLDAAGIDRDQYQAGLVVAADEHEKAALRGEDVKAADAPGTFSKASGEPEKATSEGEPGNDQDSTQN